MMDEGKILNEQQFGTPKGYGLVVLIAYENSYKGGKYKKLGNTMVGMVTSTWANQRLHRDDNT